MATFVSAAIAFALSQLLLSMLLLWQHGHWQLRERLFAGLQLAIACYLLTPVLGASGWGVVLSSLATAVPGMFWLFSASIFDDHFSLRPWQLSLVAITVALPVLGRLLRQQDGEGLGWILFTLPQGLEFVLLGLTAWAAFRHWQVDLIETRRRLRWWFVTINGGYIFALIFFREVLFVGEGWLSSWQYLPVGGMLLAMNALLLQYQEGVLWAPRENTAPAPARAAAEVDEEVVGPLRALMAEQFLYREMGLTIGQLAVRLQLPEYRLRRAINQGLGYRNFSDFLNSYRVQETARRLADPGERRLPVLTIAMDAGFRSLSSFNKAFREARDMTPTTYRKLHNK